MTWPRRVRDLGEKSTSEAMMMVRTAGHAKTHPETDARHVRRHVAISAAITALGGLLFGYDTGVVSGALLFPAS